MVTENERPRFSVGDLSNYIPVIMLALQLATFAVYFGQYSTRIANMESESLKTAQELRELRGLSQQQAILGAVQTEQVDSLARRLNTLEVGKRR